ncbi:MAG TPA: hypothetical protein VND19_14300 [Acetobacteraceae bacterium]|nr:hypothetical protein [Acetobacteraceae bacterium]
MSDDADSNMNDTTALATQVRDLTGIVGQLLIVAKDLNDRAFRGAEPGLAAVEADLRLAHVMRVLTAFAEHEELGRPYGNGLKASLASCTKELDAARTLLTDVANSRAPSS